MTKLAEYRDVNDGNRSKSSILNHANPNKVRSTVYLRYVAHGYEPAGSVARWTDGYYSVRFLLDSAFHGQRYALTKTGLEQAQAHFDRLTQS
jgi:hypothetical protein